MTEKTTLRSDQVRQPLVNTTAYWDDHATFVPKKGEIVVYSDGGSYEENGQDVPVPKIKIGDGITSVWLLHFTDDDKKGAGEHEVVYAECTLVPDIGITCNMSTGEIVELVEAGKVVLIKYGHDIYHITSYNPSKDPNVWGLSCINKTVKWIFSESHAGHKLWRTEELSIPTVNDATLTIKKNGTTIDTFSANSDTDKTIDIRVPTNAADVSALPSSTKYAASLYLSVNSSTYVVTAQLKDQDGNNIGAAQTIDLPLESVVVDGSYNAQTKKVVLTLENGSTIEFSVADLVAGLQSEITAQNPLSADLVVDGTTNKVFTLTMKTKLDGIEAGAEVNVQSDWNQTDNTADDYIKNKPVFASVDNDTLLNRNINIPIYDRFYFPNATQDYDGNWYGAVVIGDQVWLGENLKTTHDNNGTAISLESTYSGVTKCMYKPSNDVDTYGYLYTLAAATDIVPTGFHLPSRADFTKLSNYIRTREKYLNGSSTHDAKAIASSSLWSSSSVDDAIGNDLTQNNKTGFNAIPAGYVPSSSGWRPTYLNQSCSIWCTDGNFTVNKDSNVIFTTGSIVATRGYSVRCISDLTPIQFRNWYISQYGSLQHHLPEELGVPTITFRHW